MSTAPTRWMKPAASKPPIQRESQWAQPVYENLSVMPVTARLRKLTITMMCRLR